MWYLRYDDPAYAAKAKAEAERIAGLHPFVLSKPIAAVPLGWLTLVEWYAGSIKQLLRDHPEARYETLQVVSPDEGDLAIRFAASTDIHPAVAALAHRTDERAHETCEFCGGDGRVVVIEGQVAVRCPRHDRDLGYQILDGEPR